MFPHRLHQVISSLHSREVSESSTHSQLKSLPKQQLIFWAVDQESAFKPGRPIGISYPRIPIWVPPTPLQGPKERKVCSCLPRDASPRQRSPAGAPPPTKHRSPPPREARRTSGPRRSPNKARRSAGGGEAEEPGLGLYLGHLRFWGFF